MQDRSSIWVGRASSNCFRFLYAEVVVPRIVLEEVVVAGAGLTGADEVARATWLRIDDAAPGGGAGNRTLVSGIS
jgi:hypothetical protein